MRRRPEVRRGTTVFTPSQWNILAVDEVGGLGGHHVPCKTHPAQWEDAASMCHPVTHCTKTQWETQAPTLTSDRTCKEHTTCSPGTWQVWDGGAKRDRVCRKITQCSRFEHEEAPPSATSDRVCTTLSVCSRAQFESKAPTGTSNRECVSPPSPFADVC